MNVELKRVTNNVEDVNAIMDMMFHEPGIQEIFNGKQKRLLFSPFTLLIRVNSENIGFFYLVDEQVPNILFLDVGIIQKYRGKGIGRDVLEIIPDIHCSEFIICETKKDNIAANKNSSSVGVLVSETEDRNFYLMQKDRLEEFIDSDGLEKLSKKFKSTNVKQLS